MIVVCRKVSTRCSMNSSYERVHQMLYEPVVVCRNVSTRLFTSCKIIRLGTNKKFGDRLTDASVCQRKKKWHAGISSGGLPPVPGQLLTCPSFPPEYLASPYTSETESST